MSRLHPRTIRLLARTLWYGARLAPALGDSYLRNEFQERMEDLLATAAEGQDVLVVFQAGRRLHRILERIHASGNVRLEDLLLAERYVLLLMVHLRSSDRLVAPVSRPPASSRKDDEKAPVVDSVKEIEVSDTAQTVLAAIKKGGSARARDVIRRCAPLSDRTVKRCLKELADVGLVQKENREGAVFYRSV